MSVMGLHTELPPNLLCGYDVTWSWLLDSCILASLPSVSSPRKQPEVVCMVFKRDYVQKCENFMIVAMAKGDLISLIQSKLALLWLNAHKSAKYGGSTVMGSDRKSNYGSVLMY